MVFKPCLKWGIPLLLAFSPSPDGRESGLPSAAAHLRLVNEGDPGPLYECSRLRCAPSRTDDPSRKNLARTDFIVLPDGCVELREARLRPSGPGVDVVCGPEGSTATYRCQSGACNPLDPGGDERAIPLTLPRDCGGRIHELLVVDATRIAPTVYVECDASSGPVGEP